MSDMSEIPQTENATEVSGALNQNFDLLAGVSVRLSVEVGSAALKLSELLSLGKGNVVELDRQTTDPLDIFANGTLIAKGEVVNVDGSFGIRIIEVVSNDRGIGAIERRS